MMHKKLIAGMLVLLAAAAAPAALLPAGVEFDACGNLRFSDALMRWVLFKPGWRSERMEPAKFRPDAGYPRRAAGEFRTAGEWTSARFRVETAAVAEGAERFRCRSRLEAFGPVEGEALMLMLTTPAGRAGSVAVDGKKVEVPEEFRESQLFRAARAKSLSLVLGGRLVTFSGDFGLLIQDDRKFGSGEIQFRLFPPGIRSPFRAAELELSVTVEPLRAAPVNLSGVFNMGFRDDEAGDGRGGWTDQGPSNDLRMMKPGRLTVLGAPFDIADPAEDGGKACLVLSAGDGRFPASADVPVNGGGVLYLLHASAWTPQPRLPVGKIIAVYADGTKREFPVLSGQDCGNWWQPAPLSNAAVAWTGENAESFVGLYLSQFELPGSPAALRFEAAPPSRNGVSPLWMIAAATFGSRALDLRQLETPVYYVAGKQWIPLEFDNRVEPGSPLDFSAALDAPAGKYGPVTASGQGHFEFRDRPGKRVRFFGPNLVGSSNFLSKKTADEFVEKAVRMGYNTVRFHHYENELLEPGAPDSVTFDPEKLDRFFYLFAELKKRGIYLTLDVYASRWLVPGDGIAECPERTRFAMKALAPVSPTAMANWKEFARRLLTARNPYTGMTLAEDPALYCVNLMNEAVLAQCWDEWPQLIPVYEAKYAEYLKRNQLDTPENRASRGGLFLEFLNSLQEKCIAEQSRYLKDELKMAALVTDLNFLNKTTLAGMRGGLDLVDNHQYWDHPRFAANPWRLPHLYAQGSSIGRKAHLPRNMMPVRVFGKPYIVTEFNFCNPNVWRVEAAPLAGGYAGLQDWDGLYRFAWSHDRRYMEKTEQPMGFDLVNDPQGQLAERIIHMLFMRGDVKAAAPAFAFEWSPELVRGVKNFGEAADYPDEFSLLGLYARIGTLNAAASFPGVRKLETGNLGRQSALPAAARSALERLKETGRITSATGEITLDAPAKTLSVVTPKSEVFTFRREASGTFAELRNGTVYQTVALLSLDNRPLAESGRILLIHLTNLGATKQKFSDGRLSRLESWGKPPLLLEKGRVEVALALPSGGRVEALKLDGTPNGEIPSAYTDGRLRFTADTASRPGGVMACLITRKEQNEIR